MPQIQVAMPVRKISDKVSIIDIQGDVTAGAESILMNAYAEAGEPDVSTIILNFERLDYMNSSGIGLLVTLLIRANRQKQRLLGCGLNDHYKHIFGLTRLNQAIGIYDSEQEALAAAGAP